MKTFWVTGRNTPSNYSKPLRPKSPIFDPGNRLYDDQNYMWPRHKSEPVASTPCKSPQKESLTPGTWPMLEESLSPTPSKSSNNINSETINIQEIRRIQLLSTTSVHTKSSNTVSDEMKSLARSGNINTLTEFAQLAEENAQRARQLANWAKQIASVAQQNHSSTKENATHESSTDRSPPLLRPSVGSSVDKEDDLEENSSLTSTPNQERKNCIIS